MGFALWLFSRGVIVILRLAFPDWFCFFDGGLAAVFPTLETNQAYSIGLMVVVVLIVPRLINWRTDPEELARKIVETEGNLIEWTAQEALGRASLLEVTLSSGKVYVGFVLDRWTLSGENACVSLVPVLSGYRDKSTFQLRITTNYTPVLKQLRAALAKEKDGEDRTEVEDKFGHLSVKDLQVVIPSREIATARLFDLNVYDFFLKSPPWPNHGSTAQKEEQST